MNMYMYIYIYKLPKTIDDTKEFEKYSRNVTGSGCPAEYLSIYTIAYARAHKIASTRRMFNLTIGSAGRRATLPGNR